MTRIGSAYTQRISSKPLEALQGPALGTERAPEDAFSGGAPRPPPGGQLLWTDAAVEVQRNRGREQGGVDAKKSDANRGLATQYEGGGVSPADVSMLAELSGIPPERQDARQLAAAAAYVNRGTSTEDQQARLGKALDNLTVLDRIGPPKLEDKEFVEVMWDAARIPGHAIDKLPPERRAAAYQQLAGALATPGQHQLKVEKYDVKLSVADTGKVLDTRTKKPSAWKTVGKIALNVGLGVAAAFTGGAALVAVKAVQLGISAYNGIKSAVKGDWLGAIGGVAGAFGGVAGATSGATSTAAKVASTVQRGASVAQSAVVAAKTGSVAGLIGAAAEGLAAASSYSPANAKLAEAAKLTGRTAQGAAAVEAAKRGDLSGAATQALSLAQELKPKKAELLPARQLGNGMATTAPAVAGTTLSLGPMPLKLGPVGLAPAVTGTSTQPAASKPKPSEDVRTVQSALRAVGLPVTPDGLMGPKTRAALTQYQRQSGLPQTGVADLATLQALGKPRDTTAGRLQLDLARADVNLKLDAEVARTQQLLREGNRGAAVAHAAQRYLDMLQYSRGEVTKAKDPFELEAAQYALKTPGDVLNKLVTVDKNLNRDLKELGKLWVQTAATVAAAVAPVGTAAMLVSGGATAVLGEGSLKARLIEGGTDVLQSLLMEKLTAKVGGVVAKQLRQHFTDENLALAQKALERGVDLAQIVDGFASLGRR